MGEFVRSISGRMPWHSGSRQTLPRQGFFLLAALTVFWGINWPAMKLALVDVEPWTFRSLCIAIGAVGLLGIAQASGRGLTVPRRIWVPLILTSALNVTGWHMLSAFGITYMEAGRASIIAFTMPLWASILSAMFLREPMGWRRVIGLMLGLLSLLALILPALDVIRASPWGVAFMLGAAVSWAAGTVAMKSVSWGLDAVQLAGWQLTIGGLPVIVGMMLMGDPSSLVSVDWRSGLATAYAAIIPMIFCQYAWFRIVQLFPANIAAVGTLVIPVLGVFSSAVITGERLGAAEGAALLLVVVGMALVLIVPSRDRASRSR